MSCNKIAFLFLTRGEHHNIAVWEQFFQAADPACYTIAVHAKTPQLLQSPLWVGNIIKTIPTAWGTISLVKATIFLLQHAFKDAAVTKFVLLSEFCLPTTSFATMYNRRLEEQNKSIIHFTFGKNLDRYGMVKSYLPPTVSPNQWAKQSQWMCLARKHVQQLFAPPYQAFMLQWLNDFKYCPAPDEHFFINFYLHICRSGHEIINEPVTYVDWSTNSTHPKGFGYLPRDVINHCRSTKQTCFARKFYPITNMSLDDMQFLLQAAEEQEKEQEQEQEEKREEQEKEEKQEKREEHKNVLVEANVSHINANVNDIHANVSHINANVNDIHANVNDIHANKVNDNNIQFDYCNNIEQFTVLQFFSNINNLADLSPKKIKNIYRAITAAAEEEEDIEKQQQQPQAGIINIGRNNVNTTNRHKKNKNKHNGLI